MQSQINLKCPPESEFQIDADLWKQYLSPIDPTTKKLNQIHTQLKNMLSDHDALLDILTLPQDYLNWPVTEQDKYTKLHNQLSNPNLKPFQRSKIEYEIQVIKRHNRTPAFHAAKVFCTTFDFNDETKDSSRCDKTNIPLMDTVPPGKQFILGRQRLLKDYYQCKDDFLTLNSKFWDTKYWLNDIFISCLSDVFAQGFMIPNKFPVRMVLSAKLFSETDPNYAFVNQSGSIPTVSHRELCQLIEIYKLELYQSIEYNNIFFISLPGVPHDTNRFLKISIH